jgi:hypothetical protein
MQIESSGGFETESLMKRMQHNGSRDFFPSRPSLCALQPFIKIPRRRFIKFSLTMNIDFELSDSREVLGRFSPISDPTQSLCKQSARLQPSSRYITKQLKTFKSKISLPRAAIHHFPQDARKLKNSKPNWS